MGLVEAIDSSYFRSEYFSEQINDELVTHGIMLVAKLAKESALGCQKTARVSYGQYVAIWSQYLKEHPEKHHIPPNVTFGEAMNDAFPCGG